MISVSTSVSIRFHAHPPAWSLALITWLLCCAGAFAQPASIELHALPRLGGQAGTQFEMNVLDGRDLDELDQLVFSHPGIVAQLAATPADASLDSDPRWGTFQVSVGPDVPRGVYAVRAKGRFGLSNSRRFLVVHKPWMTEATGHTIGSAIDIDESSLWQDQCTAKNRKCYRIDFRAGESQRIRVYANALDSQARIVLSLVNSDLKSVATADATIEEDASLLYTAPHDGTYWMFINDHLFRGGPEYRYGIEIEKNPTSRNQDQLAQLTLQQWKDATLPLESYRIPSADTTNAIAPVSLSETLWNPNIATLRAPASDLPMAVHHEPPSGVDAPQSIAFPSIACGRFEANDDVDAFEALLEANQEITFEIVSDRLGQSTDPKLTVYLVQKPDSNPPVLKRIAEADDLPVVGSGDLRIATRDFVWTHRVSESGLYRFVIQDQQRSQRSPESARYAIALRPAQPDYVLTAHPTYPVRDLDQSRMLSTSMDMGQSFGISINAVRLEGFKLPIEVHLPNLPPSLAAPAVTIAAEQTSVQLIVTNREESKTTQGFSIANLRAEGSAKSGELSTNHVAVPMEIVWGRTSSFLSTKTRIASSLPLQANAHDLFPLAVALGAADASGTPIQAVRGQSIKIPINAVRREGGKQKIIVRLRNAPNTIAVPEVTLEANVAEGSIELQITKDAPLGLHSMWAQCESTVQLTRNPQAVERSRERIERFKKQAEATQGATSEPGPLAETIAKEQERLKKLEEAAKPRDYPVQIPSAPVSILIVEAPK